MYGEEGGVSNENQHEVFPAKLSEYADTSFEKKTNQQSSGRFDNGASWFVMCINPGALFCERTSYGGQLSTFRIGIQAFPQR